jgi:hypothetical protein
MIDEWLLRSSLAALMNVPASRCIRSLQNPQPFTHVVPMASDQNKKALVIGSSGVLPGSWYQMPTDA